MSAEKESWISIMIVPEDGAGVRNWRLSTTRFRQLKVGFWLVMVLLIAGIFSSVGLGFMWLKVHRLERANADLIESAGKIELIASRLSVFEERERHLQQILGGDLGLGAPVTVEQYARARDAGRDVTSGSFAEIENAVAAEESRLRSIPNIWPVDAWQITKEFSYSGNPRVDHPAIDILSWKKSLVVSTADGVVTFAGPTDDLGLKVTIDHGNGYVTEYGHNLSLQVKYGDRVKKGQTIAIFGGSDSGASGPHLHYAIYFEKTPKDPLSFIAPKWQVAEKE